MIPMSQLTCAVKEIAQPDGNDALANQTIDVFRNGCSAMAKMIAAITAMNCQRIVQFVILTPISNAQTTDAFQSKCSKINIYHVTCTCLSTIYFIFKRNSHMFKKQTNKQTTIRLLQNQTNMFNKHLILSLDNGRAISLMIVAMEGKFQ